MKKFIPVAEPALVGNEKKYVLDCLDSNWISSNGIYIDRFEQSYADFCGTKHAMSCTNGTVALHLALMALDIGPGDEVIVPTMTYVAVANAVRYCGAKPVFVDSEPQSWNMDASLIEERIGIKTKAIIVVHLFGLPASLGRIVEIAKKHGLYVIEDAAEAHGATYDGRKVGSVGDIGTFSFYGNKVLATGEGGMVVTNSNEIEEKVRLLKGQGMDPQRRYWFPLLGYNYRMTNIVAAIGLAQLEKQQWHLAQRQRVANCYKHRLAGHKRLALQQNIDKDSEHVYWMVGVVLSSDCSIAANDVMRELKGFDIETRPFFVCMHKLPMYAQCGPDNEFQVADFLSNKGLCLPTYASLKNEQIDFICDRLETILDTWH